MQSFVRGCSLRQIFVDGALPEELEGLKAPFEKAFSGDYRGTLLNDMLASSSTSDTSTATNIKPKKFKRIPDELSHLFASQIGSPPQRVALLHEFTHNGIGYATHSYLPNDSNILFSETGDCQTSRKAARINSIFVPRISAGKEPIIYVVLDVYRPLEPEHTKYDYYRKWPRVAGSLFYDEFEPDQKIITPSSIICHAVNTSYKDPKIGTACVHFLPLDRVGHLVAAEPAFTHAFETGLEQDICMRIYHEIVIELRVFPTTDCFLVPLYFSPATLNVRYLHMCRC